MNYLFMSMTILQFVFMTPYEFSLHNKGVHFYHSKLLQMFSYLSFRVDLIILNTEV